jgi:hypothetical protein
VRFRVIVSVCGAGRRIPFGRASVLASLDLLRFQRSLVSRGRSPSRPVGGSRADLIRHLEADNAAGFGDTARLKPAVILWNQLGGTRAGNWKDMGKPRDKDEVVDRTPPPTTCDIMHLFAQSDSSDGFNPEHSQTSPLVDLAGAANVRIFGTKVESRHQDVFHIKDCNNILIVGFGGHAAIHDGGSVFLVQDSTNVEVAEAGCGKPNEKGSVITEIGAGSLATSVNQKYLLALFKRGQVDDQPWTVGKD